MLRNLFISLFYSKLQLFFVLTVCALIEKLSFSKMPFKNDPVISKLIII